MKANMLTDIGKQYLNEAIANGTEIELSEISLGDGMVTSELEVGGLTELKSKKMIYGISEITESLGINSIKAEITNLELQNGFRIREVGIYAKKADGSKILFWYINYDDESSWLQSIGSGLIRSPLVVKLVINVENLTITNVCDLDVVATRQYVDAGLGTKLTVTEGKIDKKLHFGTVEYNAIHPRSAADGSDGAFITINKLGSNVIGLGSDGVTNEVRIGLARSEDGSWIDPDTQEARATNVNFDGGVVADRLKSRSGEIALGENGEAKIKFNSDSGCIDFIFEIQ